MCDLIKQGKVEGGRGLPGTHDLPRLGQVFRDILDPQRTRPIQIPVYDKSKYEGQGDRAGYRLISEPIQVWIVEGWFIGMRISIHNTPIFMDSTESSKLHSISELIDQEYLPIWKRISAWIQLKPNSGLEISIEWRWQQEQNLAAQTGTKVMDRMQIAKFCERFLNCLRYMEHFITMDANLSESHHLTILHLDDHHGMTRILDYQP